MNREKIIKLALKCGESTIGGLRLHTFCVEELERFAAAIEAEQAEVIASQQARIAGYNQWGREVIAEMQRHADKLENTSLEISCRLLMKFKSMASTDDLSALNEAKAKVLDEAADCFSGVLAYNFLAPDCREYGRDVAIELNYMAQEIRGQ